MKENKEGVSYHRGASYYRCPRCKQISRYTTTCKCVLFKVWCPELDENEIDAISCYGNSEDDALRVWFDAIDQNRIKGIEITLYIKSPSGIVSKFLPEREGDDMI